MNGKAWAYGVLDTPCFCPNGLAQNRGLWNAIAVGLISANDFGDKREGPGWSLQNGLLKPGLRRRNLNRNF